MCKVDYTEKILTSVFADPVVFAAPAALAAAHDSAGSADATTCISGMYYNGSTCLVATAGRFIHLYFSGRSFS